MENPEFATRAEVSQAVAHFDSSVDRLSSQIERLNESLAETFERRSASSRQVWLAISGFFLTTLASGAALVWFAISGATEPLRDQIDRSREDVAILQQHDADSLILRGRQQVTEELLLRDVKIEHGAPGSSGKLGAVVQLQGDKLGELWQINETLQLQIQKLNERVAVLSEKGKD